MATEPDNTPFDRFLTFGLALLVFSVFGIAAVILLGGKGLLSSDEASDGSDEARRTEVVEKWEGSVKPPKIDAAKAVTLLKARAVAPTKIVVPGSKTQLDQAGVAAPPNATGSSETAPPIAPPIAAAPTVSPEALAKLMADGKTAYMTNCFACHGPDGKGLKAGPLVMAPSFVGSKYALGDPSLFTLITMRGILKEPGNTDFAGVMVPPMIKDDDAALAAVMTYIRNSWGNKASAITAEQVAVARKEHAGVEGPVTRALLEEMLKK